MDGESSAERFLLRSKPSHCVVYVSAIYAPGKEGREGGREGGREEGRKERGREGGRD